MIGPRPLAERSRASDQQRGNGSEHLAQFHYRGRRLGHPGFFGQIAISGDASALPVVVGDQVVTICSLGGTRGRIYAIGAPSQCFVRRAVGQCLVVLGDAASVLNELPQTGCDADLASLVQSAGEMDSLSIALSERPNGSLLLELRTDRWGFRTLYFHLSAGVLTFATHLHGLRMALGGRLPAATPQALLHYYLFGVAPSDRALLDGVEKLPPGTLLSAGGSEIHIGRFFEPLDLKDASISRQTTERELVRRIDSALEQAVVRRATASGSVALALSGGVDSGYLGAKLKGAGIRTQGYHLAYQRHYDEDARVARLTNRLAIPCRRVEVDATAVLAAHEEGSRWASEPLGFNDAAMRLLYEHVRDEGFSELWDGDGADRLFLGMNSHLRHQRAHRAYLMLKHAGIARLAAEICFRLPTRGLSNLGTAWLNWLNGIPPYPERKHGIVSGYDVRYERAVFDLGMKQFWERFRQQGDAGDFGAFFTYVGICMCPERFFHPAVEQRYQLGIRSVSPYWDDAIVAIALALPTRWKLRRGHTKYILRRAAAAAGDARYWHLPKVGLQNAWRFVLRSRVGQAWRLEAHAALRETDEIRFLASVVRDRPIDLDRLVPYLVWRRAIS